MDFVADLSEIVQGVVPAKELAAGSYGWLMSNLSAHERWTVLAGVAVLSLALTWAVRRRLALLAIKHPTLTLAGLSGVAVILLIDFAGPSLDALCPAPVTVFAGHASRIEATRYEGVAWRFLNGVPVVVRHRAGSTSMQMPPTSCALNPAEQSHARDWIDRELELGVQAMTAQSGALLSKGLPVGFDPATNRHLTLSEGDLSVNLTAESTDWDAIARVTLVLAGELVLDVELRDSPLLRPLQEVVRAAMSRPSIRTGRR